MVGRTLTPERAIRQPWRLDLRVVLSALVTLAAIGGMLVYAGSLSATRPVLLVTRDLPAGAILGPDDLTVTQVRVDDSIYAAALSGDALSAVLGKPLAEPVHSQQILARAQVSSRPRLAPDRLALAIPIKPESAAGGRLRAGDEVQILLTRNKGKPEADTVVVLERATIYSVGYDERATVINAANASRTDTGPLASLTLIVMPDQARALATARHSGELDVALLPPLPLAAETVPTSAPTTASPTVNGR